MSKKAIAKKVNKMTYGARGLPLWVLALIFVWALQYTIADGFDPYLFSIVMYSGVNIIMAVSLNLVNGINGQFSMGHAGFMAVGAYASALITTSVFEANPEINHYAQVGIFLGSLMVGGIFAATIGYLVGLPSLRLRGDYLAIVTLGFGEIIRVVLLNMNIVGGARGMPGIPQMSTFGWVFTFVILTVFCISRIINSARGRVFLSIREDEIASEAMGVNTTQGKVQAFAIGAFFAGIAGGLYAHYLQFLVPQTFDFNRSFEIIIMVVLGGMGSISGSIVAAVFLTGIREALRPLQEYTQVDFRMVIYSLVLIILMLTKPNGLFGRREITDFFPFKRRKPEDKNASTKV